MHNLSTLFIFSPKNLRAKLSKGCLRGFVNTNKYIKSAWATLLTIFLKKKNLKNTILILLKGSPLILPEVMHGKTKPNRWVESSPKMGNLHRCQSLQKFSKYEKTTETYWLRSSPPSTPISVSRRLKVKRLGAKVCVAFLLFSFWKDLWRFKVKESMHFVEQKYKL